MQEFPSKTFQFVGSQGSIKLFEDFENDTANGTRLWEAGMLLSCYFEREVKSSMKGKRILEVGAGTGLVSIYLGRLGAARILACDYNQIVFDLLKLNIVENEVSDNVEARKFDWGDESHVDAVAAEEWDLVIGADCVFSLAATKPLVACLDRLIKSPDIVGYQSIETRDDAVTAAFLEGIRNHGLDVVSVSLRGIHKKYLHEDLAIYKITRA